MPSAASPRRKALPEDAVDDDVRGEGGRIRTRPTRGHERLARLPSSTKPRPKKPSTAQIAKIRMRVRARRACACRNVLQRSGRRASRPGLSVTRAWRQPVPCGTGLGRRGRRAVLPLPHQFGLPGLGRGGVLGVSVDDLRQILEHLRPVDRFAGQADLVEELVDEGRLRPVAQRRGDHLLGEISLARARAVLRTRPVSADRRRRPHREARQALDMEDLDALDLLHRLDALADDRRQVLDQGAGAARCGGLRRSAGSPPR